MSSDDPSGLTAPSPPLERVRTVVDDVLAGYLTDRRSELAGMDPAAASLVDELDRLLRAGGKRFRPALCFWAFEAAGGTTQDPIERVCGAIELLHTSALVHDDLMDRDDRRRGVASTHAWFAKHAPLGTDPDGYGASVAILVGDLALVLSEQLMRTSGFPPDRLDRAMSRFDRMRAEMAAGQFLDISGSTDRERVRALKTGSYTAEGPVMIGAALAGADVGTEGSLRVFGRLAGQAFQLRDDELDGDASDGAPRVDDLVSRASRALEDAPLRRRGVDALIEISSLLRLPPGS